MIRIKVIYDRKDCRQRRTCFWKVPLKRIMEGSPYNYCVDYISIADTLTDYFCDSGEDTEENANLKCPKEETDVVDINHGEGKNCENENSKVPKVTRVKSREELFEPSLPRLFSNKNDIIIINWDSINTDPVYGSDRAYQFFKHYKTGLNSWVENGGILILEAQSAQWKLVQDSYSIFDENIVVSRGVGDRGSKGIVNKKLMESHPIVGNIGDEITLGDNHLCDNRWYPIKCESTNIQACDREDKRRKLYQGWFEKYPKKRWLPLRILRNRHHKKQWTPLIFAGDYGNHHKKPIMLCYIPEKKSDGNNRVGAYIVTTMYLGSSDCDKLITNLVNLPKTISTYYYSQEATNAEHDKKQAIIITGSLIFFSLLYIVILKPHFTTICNGCINYISEFIILVLAALTSSAVWELVPDKYKHKPA